MTLGLIVIMLWQPGAQSLREGGRRPPGDPDVTRRASSAVASQEVIELLVGRSTVLPTTRPITRVSLSTPEVADALVTESNQVLIHGKAPGTISLLVWDTTGRIDGYDVVVRRDLSSLEGRLSQLFPGEPIEVASNGTDIVIAGTVSSKYVVDKAAAVAVGYVESAENVVNLLQQQEGQASEQIMLRVRFAEVSRTAVQELGASFFTSLLGKDNWVGRLTTQQFPAPEFDNEEGLVFSDFLNVFAFNQQENVGTVIRAMQQRGLLQSLAEPNLITQNGSEASFLAGGEFPFPVIQGAGAQASVTIQFKEFGVRLLFTPTLVGGDRINLEIEPEVSSLDFANAVQVEGFRIPALTTRRTRTAVELRDGQTFAVAGLIDNTVTEQMQKIPGLGDIPILGLLFKSRAYQKSNTELVVMITPHIVREGEMGVTDALPQLAQPFLEPIENPLLPPAAPGGSSVAGAAARFAPKSGAGPLAEPPTPVVTAWPTERERREAAKAAEADARRQAELDRKAADAARERAERERKADEARARVDAKQAAERAKREAKLAAEEAKRAAEAAKRQAELDRKAAEVARKQAERERKEEVKRARVEAKQAAERAKREAKWAAEEAKRAEEAAKRQAELDRKAAEAARKQAERERTAEEERARAEAKRAEEDAERQAELDRQAAEAARNQAEHARRRATKLEAERAKREAELQELLDEYLPKLTEVQQALDDIDDERTVLVVPWRDDETARDAASRVDGPAR